MRLKMICLLSLLFMGCYGSGRFTTVKKGIENPPPARSFTVLEVSKKSKISDSLQELVATALNLHLRIAMEKEKLVYRDSLPDLSIKILIEDIKPGNAGLRYLGSIFALMGKGRVLVMIKTTNKDGMEIFRGEAEGTVTGGSWGGSITDACKRIASAYVEEYRKQTGG